MTFLDKGHGCSTVEKLSDSHHVCSVVPCRDFYSDYKTTQMQLPKTPSFVTREATYATSLQLFNSV